MNMNDKDKIIVEKRHRMCRIHISDEVKAKVREMYLAKRKIKDIIIESGINKDKIGKLLNELFPDRGISEELKKKYITINNLYIKGMKVSDIMRNINVSKTGVYDALHRFQTNLREIQDLSETIKRIEKLKPTVEVCSEKSKDIDAIITVVKTKCEHCKKDLKIQVSRFRTRYLESKNPIFCKKCKDMLFASDYLSKKPKMKSNTSGYIGVSIHCNRKHKPLGFRLRVDYKRKILIQKYFFDDTLSDKTLLEAAIYREKYIIDNNIPHTRNFTDSELISNMEMLGQHDEINKYVYDKYFV